jgi:hypothetical protein
MRDDQQRHTQTHDGHLRRKDAVSPRQFARALDCGGDGRSASAMHEPRHAWPAARALGTPRDGTAEADETPPDAA